PVPSVQLVDAMPLEFVLELSGLTEPPPSTTDQLMVTPATELLSASATRTDKGTGSVWPTVSVWPCPPLIAICVAPPTCAWTLNVTGVRPAALAVVVCVPGVGPRVRVVDACPAASVTDEVGFSDPPPDAAAQVTVTLGRGYRARRSRARCAAWRARCRPDPPGCRPRTSRGSPRGPPSRSPGTSRGCPLGQPPWR